MKIIFLDFFAFSRKYTLTIRRKYGIVIERTEKSAPLARRTRRTLSRMQKYPRGSRGSPAKGVVPLPVARVRISSSAPRKKPAFGGLFAWHKKSARSRAPGQTLAFRRFQNGLRTEIFEENSLFCAQRMHDFPAITAGSFVSHTAESNPAGGACRGMRGSPCCRPFFKRRISDRKEGAGAVHSGKAYKKARTFCQTGGGKDKSRRGVYTRGLTIER